MIRAIPNNGDSPIIVDSDVQSVAEDVMTRLGYGCADYTLETVNRIWLLKPRVFDADNMPSCVTSWKEWVFDNPWDSKFNKAFGFVIEAGTEREARELADGKAGAENECSKYPHPWLNQGITVCEELAPTGTPRVVLTDFYPD